MLLEVSQKNIDFSSSFQTFCFKSNDFAWSFCKKYQKPSSFWRSLFKMQVFFHRGNPTEPEGNLKRQNEYSIISESEPYYARRIFREQKTTPKLTNTPNLVSLDTYIEKTRNVNFSKKKAPPQRSSFLLGRVLSCYYRNCTTLKLTFHFELHLTFSHSE